jgi:hypothetical protein
MRVARAVPILAVAASAVLAACGDSSGPGPTTNQPSVPVVPQVAEVPVPANYGAHDTYVRDGIAFLCAWNTGLIILDVGNGVKGGSPSSPAEISRILTSADGVSGGAQVHNAWWFHNPVTSENRYVFIGQEGPATIPTTSTGDIHVVDVSDMAHPLEVGFYHMNASPAAGTHNFWMNEAAQILYAAYYNGGVVALDVSGTLSGDLSGREITRFKPSANAFVWGVQLSGGYLYATDMLNGLYQLGISGSSFTVAGGGGNVLDRYSSDLWVGGGYAYTGTWGGASRNGILGNALKIWRLGASGAPSLIDSIVTPLISTVSDVKGSADGKVLVTSAENGPNGGLYVYTLADPAHPVLVAMTTVAAGLHTAKVADIGGRRYVFAARNPGSSATPALVIYDITAFSP